MLERQTTNIHSAPSLCLKKCPERTRGKNMSGQVQSQPQRWKNKIHNFLKKKIVLWQSILCGKTSLLTQGAQGKCFHSLWQKSSQKVTERFFLQTGLAALLPHRLLASSHLCPLPSHMHYLNISSPLVLKEMTLTRVLGLPQSIEID